MTNGSSSDNIDMLHGVHVTNGSSSDNIDMLHGVHVTNGSSSEGSTFCTSVLPATSAVQTAVTPTAVILYI